MPGINDMLGNVQPGKPTNTPFGQPKPKEDQQPQDEAEDLLGTLNNPPKVTAETKKVNEASFDMKTINDMVMTGNNVSGLFEGKSNVEHPSSSLTKDSKPNFKVKGTFTPSSKYTKSFSEIIKGNPMKMIWTPRGKMTIKEAYRLGYNPLTQEFDDKHNFEKIKEKELAKADEKDRDAIERMISKKGKMSDAERKRYNVNDDEFTSGEEEEMPAQATTANEKEAVPTAPGAVQEQQMAEEAKPMLGKQPLPIGGEEDEA